MRLNETSPFEGIDRSQLIHPPAAIASFVRLLTSRHAFAGNEKRERTRHAITLPVIVQPMDCDYSPVDKAFRTLTRDITTEGLGFVHIERIATPFVAVEITELGGAHPQRMQVLLKLRPCKRIHDRLFHIGGKFVMRWDGEAT